MGNTLDPKMSSALTDADLTGGSADNSNNQNVGTQQQNDPNTNPVTSSQDAPPFFSEKFQSSYHKLSEFPKHVADPFYEFLGENYTVTPLASPLHYFSAQVGLEMRTLHLNPDETPVAVSARGPEFSVGVQGLLPLPNPRFPLIFISAGYLTSFSPNRANPYGNEGWSSQHDFFADVPANPSGNSSDSNYNTTSNWNASHHGVEIGLGVETPRTSDSLIHASVSGDLNFVQFRENNTSLPYNLMYDGQEIPSNIPGSAKGMRGADISATAGLRIPNTPLTVSLAGSKGRRTVALADSDESIKAKTHSIGLQIDISGATFDYKRDPNDFYAVYPDKDNDGLGSSDQIGPIAFLPEKTMERFHKKALRKYKMELNEGDLGYEAEKAATEEKRRAYISDLVTGYIDRNYNIKIEVVDEDTYQAVMIDPDQPDQTLYKTKPYIDLAELESLYNEFNNSNSSGKQEIYNRYASDRASSNVTFEDVKVAYIAAEEKAHTANADKAKEKASDDNAQIDAKIEALEDKIADERNGNNNARKISQYQERIEKLEKKKANTDDVAQGARENSQDTKAQKIDRVLYLNEKTLAKDADGQPIVSIVSNDKDKDGTKLYRDNDNDGYGVENQNKILDSDSVVTASQVQGWSEKAGDCDDNDPNIYPAFEGDTSCVKAGTDADQDGYVADGAPIKSVNAGRVDSLSYAVVPEDASQIERDCDDDDASINPGAVDVPGDGIDQDCDGVDSRADAVEVRVDADGDGYAAPGDALSVSRDEMDSNPQYVAATQFLNQADDCADDDASIHPGAVDIPADGIDQNCDGVDATPQAVVILDEISDLFADQISNELDILAEFSAHHFEFKSGTLDLKNQDDADILRNLVSTYYATSVPLSHIVVYGDADQYPDNVTLEANEFFSVIRSGAAGTLIEQEWLENQGSLETLPPMIYVYNPSSDKPTTDAQGNEVTSRGFGFEAIVDEAALASYQDSLDKIAREHLEVLFEGYRSNATKETLDADFANFVKAFQEEFPLEFVRENSLDNLLEAMANHSKIGESHALYQRIANSRDEIMANAIPHQKVDQSQRNQVYNVVNNTTDTVLFRVDELVGADPSEYRMRADWETKRSVTSDDPQFEIIDGNITITNPKGNFNFDNDGVYRFYLAKSPNQPKGTQASDEFNNDYEMFVFTVEVHSARNIPDNKTYQPFTELETTPANIEDVVDRGEPTIINPNDIDLSGIDARGITRDEFDSKVTELLMATISDVPLVFYKDSPLTISLTYEVTDEGRVLNPKVSGINADGEVVMPHDTEYSKNVAAMVFSIQDTIRDANSGMRYSFVVTQLGNPSLLE